MLIPLAGIRLVLAAAALLALTAPFGAASIERAAEYQDAYVEFDNARNRWRIGNEAIRFAIELDRRGWVRLVGLFIADAEDPATRGQDPEALLTIDGETVRLGAEGSGFKLERVDSATGTHFVALTVRWCGRLDYRVASRHQARTGIRAPLVGSRTCGRDERRRCDRRRARHPQRAGVGRTSSHPRAHL